MKQIESLIYSLLPEKIPSKTANADEEEVKTSAADQGSQALRVTIRLREVRSARVSRSAMVWLLKLKPFLKRLTIASRWYENQHKIADTYTRSYTYMHSQRLQF